MEIGDTTLIPPKRDGKTMNIPDWICTCKNAILDDNHHNPPVLLQFSP